MNEAGEIKEIRVLLFTVMGIRFAMEMLQIYEIRPFKEDRDNGAFIWLHEKLDFGGRKISYKSPGILMIKDEVAGRGIILEYPEDIDIPVKLDSIKPLPVLMESANPGSPVWGIFILDGEPVLLLDSYRLFACDDLTQAGNG